MKGLTKVTQVHKDMDNGVVVTIGNEECYDLIQVRKEERFGTMQDAQVTFRSGRESSLGAYVLADHLKNAALLAGHLDNGMEVDGAVKSVGYDVPEVK